MGFFGVFGGFSLLNHGSKTQKTSIFEFGRGDKAILVIFGHFGGGSGGVRRVVSGGLGPHPLQIWTKRRMRRVFRTQIGPIVLTPNGEKDSESSPSNPPDLEDTQYPPLPIHSVSPHCA